MRKTETNKYDLLELISDLKHNIGLILNEEISDPRLSRLLGMGERYIFRIRQEIDYKEFYSVQEKTIKKWRKSLSNQLGSNIQKILALIKRFEIFQKEFPLAQRTSFHPNLDYEFFDNIDSKLKAYWLGLLYADGNVGKDNRITLKLSMKDEILIINFSEAIGFNKEKIEFLHNKNHVQMRIGNMRLAAALKKHGCVPNKSKIIRLPVLSNRELDLAFLLGYFDGDGTIGTSRITSGSKKFLNDIKQKFNIKNKIHTRIGAYDIYIGADLFNKMLDNYHDSLPRKRIRLESSIKRNKRLKEERDKYLRRN